MANYLILCADRENREQIERWFSVQNEYPQDLLKLAEQNGTTCWYLAHQGKEDKTPDAGLFKGYAIDHESRQILYSGGAQALAPSIHRPLPGCYIRVQREHDHLLVGNDLFSLLPMLYFFEKGIMAISDSVFILTELRRHLGIANRIHREAALSRAWIHGMASQPLGTQTLIDGISYCPPGTRLHIDLAQNGPRLRMETTPAGAFFSAPLTDYRETVREGARRTASVIAALVRIPEAAVSLSLSGGLDSRVCLAAARAAKAQQSIFFQTNPANKDDFEIAKLLARHFQFDFNTPPYKKMVPHTADAGWFLSCAGIYDPLSNRSFAVWNKEVEITGVGAETCKGYYGWRTLSQIKPNKVGYVSAIRPARQKYLASIHHGKQPRHFIPDALFSALQFLIRKIWASPKVEQEIARAAYRQSCSGLKSIGVTNTDSFATEWHYLCFNAPIHCGRFSMRSILHCAPLLQQTLVALSRSSLNAYPQPTQGAPSIMTDLLITLDPELAAMLFDDPAKNLAPAYIRERSQILGRVRDIEPYALSGAPDAVGSGTPRMFRRLLASRNLDRDFTPEIVKELALQGFDAIPQDIKKAYGLHKYIVENEFPARLSSRSWHCKAAGKLMAFLLAD